MATDRRTKIKYKRCFRWKGKLHLDGRVSPHWYRLVFYVCAGEKNIWHAEERTKNGWRTLRLTSDVKLVIEGCCISQLYRLADSKTLYQEFGL